MAPGPDNKKWKSDNFHTEWEDDFIFVTPYAKLALW